MNLLWLQSGGCGGCSMSLLCADTPDLPALLADAGLHLLWHPSLSRASGAEFLTLLEDCLAGRVALDVLCIEGALLRGPGGSGRFHVLAGTGVPMIHWVERLARVARHVVAVGACAAWGGVSASGDNPTEACGLQFEDEQPGGLLGADFRARAGLPVVNVAGCPTHPGWVIDTLMALAEAEPRPAPASGAVASASGAVALAGEVVPTEPALALDAYHRPRFYADQLVHHGCTRNEYYEFKASAEQPSALGCLMEHLGCKGTQAHADCNTRLWNGEGSCTRGGYACISCTEPGFQTPGHAFDATPKLAGIPIGLPTDMPKAWFVALASLAKSATPKRVRSNAEADHLVTPPAIRSTRRK